MWPLVVSLLSGPVAAGLVGEPPEGARSVTLLVCPDPATCSDETAFVTHAPDFAREPILLVDHLLALNAARQDDNTARAITFHDGLDAARTAVGTADMSAATFALDRAEQALAGWTGTCTNQELFDLHYLRGVVALARGYAAEDSFRAAAAVAWNRTVRLPVPHAGAATAYYAALEATIADGTGRLRLDPGPPGTSYWLDGVELGPGPLQVDVFAGAHRITAFHPASTQEWRGEAVVAPGRTQRARARLSLADDAAWVTDQLDRAVEAHQMDPELGALLLGWCEHFGLRSVQIVRAAPRPELAAAFDLHVVAYDPVARRFTTP